MKTIKSIILFLSIFAINNSTNASEKNSLKKLLSIEEQSAADNIRKYHAVKHYCPDITLPIIKESFGKFSAEEVENMNEKAMFCAVYNVFSTAQVHLHLPRK